MVGRERKIVWDETPKQFFKEAIIYIRKSSSQNADKVKSEILLAIRALVEFPEKHSPDKYKANNVNAQFRAFVKFSLRVSYFVSKYQIRIVRIRHVKQLPERY
ncbi:MAG: type II toxin-antitoxin system RelE/ParE family toxin [Segetibacter sp.]